MYAAESRTLTKAETEEKSWDINMKKNLWTLDKVPNDDILDRVSNSLLQGNTKKNYLDLVYFDTWDPVVDSTGGLCGRRDSKRKK